MAQAIHLGKAAPLSCNCARAFLNRQRDLGNILLSLALMNATILEVLMDGLPSNGLCRPFTT